jgi:hypothetical protein
MIDTADGASPSRSGSLPVHLVCLDQAAAPGPRARLLIHSESEPEWGSIPPDLLRFGQVPATATAPRNWAGGRRTPAEMLCCHLIRPLRRRRHGESATEPIAGNGIQGASPPGPPSLKVESRWREHTVETGRRLQGYIR